MAIKFMSSKNGRLKLCVFLGRINRDTLDSSGRAVQGIQNARVYFSRSLNTTTQKRRRKQKTFNKKLGYKKTKRLPF